VKTPNIYRLKKRILKVLKALKIKNGELSILFTGNSEIKKLNKKFRNRDKATDVLSFPSGDTDGFLGDIAISLPIAKRQAKAIGNSFEREVLFLILHGLLHLVGYDHEQTVREADKMIAMEKKLMKAGYAK